MTYSYYTDGASTMRKVDGKYVREAGGWAFVELENGLKVNETNGGAPYTTNNAMELYAILAALRQFLSHEDSGAKIEIYSDSAYCINIYTQWAENWEKNGWTRGKKHEPIENLEIIKETWRLLSEIKSRFSTVEFIKVKGHAGNHYNEIADELAVTGKLSAASDKIVKGYRWEDDILLH